MADHRSGAQPVTFLQALPLAIGDVQRLFGGADGRRRWKALAWTAIMGGAVGVGIQPPPLGLLHPAWEDPASRETVVTALGPAAPLLLVLAVVLLGFAVWARAFILALVEGVLAPGEKPAPYGRYLLKGAGHFLWSACLSVPLYLLLFVLEGATTQAGWERLLHATEAEIAPVAVQASLGFLAVLIPWVILTLPLMVFQYELVPVAMVRSGKGALAAAALVLREMKASPGRFGGYFAGRLVFQFLGASVMTLVAVPCLVVSAVAATPILLGGWTIATSAGGWSTGAGAASGTITILLGCALFYCITCAALLPLTALPFLLANRVLGLSEIPSGQSLHAGSAV